MDEFERLKQEIMTLLAKVPHGLGFYKESAERILREVVYPHIDTIKAGYEEKMFKDARNLKDH